MKIINILGVNITNENNTRILEKVYSFLDGNKAKYIVTPNPEIILKTKKDEELFYIINNADLSLPDAMGLKISALFLGKNLKRFTGADLTSILLDYSEKNNYKIAILNWQGGLSRKEDIEKALQKKYPKLSFYIQDIDREGKLTNLEKLNQFSPHLLFSTLGSPWQEKNIFYLKDKIKNLKIALAVGGSFDFVAGKKIRAPWVFRRVGLEWFWRLLMQPARIKRIYNATIVFIYNFIIWRFIHPLKYRPNVACLLYKKENNSIKILLVRRNKKEEHWQLPQGGTDGETIQKAGERELREELGNNKFEKIASFNYLYKYKFPDNFNSKYNAPANLIEGYKGQKQGLFIAEFVGEDRDIKINFWEHKDWMWADVKEVLKIVHPARKEAMTIYLNKLEKFIK